MAIESIPTLTGFRVGSGGHAYNEPAFRYFLDADRKRVDRAERSIILLLVSVRREPGRNSLLTDATASALFAGLVSCVREVDFVGWYRDGRIAGAVLPQPPGVPPELRGAIAARILASLQQFLPAAAGRHLRVRVVQLQGKEHR
jgi:hypothetical protein